MLRLARRRRRARGETTREVIRGQQRLVQFHPRLRVEVLVAENNVEHVAQAFEHYAPGSRAFVEAIAPATNGAVRKLEDAVRN